MGIALKYMTSGEWSIKSSSSYNSSWRKGWSDEGTAHM